MEVYNMAEEEWDDLDKAIDDDEEEDTDDDDEW